MKKVLASVFLTVMAVAVSNINGQMVNLKTPKKGEPFSYPSAPTDEIALKGAQLGTEITPCGYLYTGYGELDFLIGYPARLACQQVRTVDKGYLPIFEYRYRDGSVRYDITTFSYPLRENEPDLHPVNLIRVIARNVGATAQTSHFSVGFRYAGKVVEPSGLGDHRFRRPVAPSEPGQYSQPGVQFNPNWVYGFSKTYAVRSGKVVYQFPLNSKPMLWTTRSELYTKSRQLHVLRDTPVLLAQYALHLSPGGSQTLVFKMPVEPIELHDTDKLASLSSIDFSKAMGATVDKWEGILSRGLQIRLPERKVVDTFRSSLVYDMMARDHVGDNYIQTVNKLQYHAFWLRDGAHIMNAYDVAGYLDLVRQSLPFFLKFQKPDGLFISQSGQYDGWGQALWAFGLYYQFSHDRAFAHSVFPAVLRAVHWLERARESDPLHLMPATNPHDAEFTKVVAHVSGHNFWGLDGLRGAIILAKAVGTDQDVREFQQDYNNYHEVLINKLREVTSEDNGYIPPGIDVQGGQDWGNMDTLYPEVLLPPFDPMVTGTIRATRAKYGEGLMTYAGRLHHYITMKNTEAELVRGEQEQAVKDLYAVLVHTSSTNAGWEVGPLPWTTRDFGEDLAPHGWFAAEYIILLRNMLLREEGNELHLLSALSPAWCKPGDSIVVDNAPTFFGGLGLKAMFSAHGMTVDVNAQFRSEPKDIVIHMPWFVTPQNATVDGRPMKVMNNRLIVPSMARRIIVTWVPRQNAFNLSYSKAVDQFVKEYSNRYQQFLRVGASQQKHIARY